MEPQELTTTTFDDLLGGGAIGVITLVFPMCNLTLTFGDTHMTSGSGSATCLGQQDTPWGSPMLQQGEGRTQEGKSKGKALLSFFFGGDKAEALAPSPCSCFMPLMSPPLSPPCRVHREAWWWLFPHEGGWGASSTRHTMHIICSWWQLTLTSIGSMPNRPRIVASMVCLSVQTQLQQLSPPPHAADQVWQHQEEDYAQCTMSLGEEEQIRPSRGLLSGSTARVLASSVTSTW